MDNDAVMAFGTVLAVLGGLLERNGLCTTMEFANMIGNMAVVTKEAGPEYEKRAAYVGRWAHCVLAAAQGPQAGH